MADRDPVPRSRWRHLKRGSSYSVVASGTLQTGAPLPDGADLVAYRGGDGRWWFRPPAEFLDGRYERVRAEEPDRDPVAEARALLASWLPRPDTDEADDGFTCDRCGAAVCADPERDAEGICDPCAQEIAAAAMPLLSALADETEQARARLAAVEAEAGALRASLGAIVRTMETDPQAHSYACNTTRAPTAPADSCAVCDCWVADVLDESDALGYVCPASGCDRHWIVAPWLVGPPAPAPAPAECIRCGDHAHRGEFCPCANGESRRLAARAAMDEMHPPPKCGECGAAATHVRPDVERRTVVRMCESCYAGTPPATPPARGPGSFADIAAAAIRGMQAQATARLLYEVARAVEDHVLGAPRREFLAEYRRLAAGDAATGRTWGDWHAENPMPTCGRSLMAGAFGAWRTRGLAEAAVVRSFARDAPFTSADPRDTIAALCAHWGIPLSVTVRHAPRPPPVADARGAGAWSPPAWSDEVD